MKQEQEKERKVAEAEARRQVTEAARFDKEQKLKEAAKKQQLLLKERKVKSRQDEQKKAAERSLSQAKSRTTISLGDLFGNIGGSDKGSPPQAPSPIPKQQKQVSKPPPGVPTVSKWSQNPDGSINGNLGLKQSSSSFFVMDQS